MESCQPIKRLKKKKRKKEDSFVMWTAGTFDRK
jgi:hypothetical protein